MLLGAGYDSRTYRFSSQLRSVRAFEVDHPATQMKKRRILDRTFKDSPPVIAYVPVDFNRDSLEAALLDRGLSRQKKTLFLWEGVSYYLPESVVRRLLMFVSGFSGGSSILFDYAIKDFVDGNHGTFGGRQVARWLHKIKEPFLFGMHPGEAGDFLSSCGLELVSDLGPEELENLYLTTKSGGSLGRMLGHIRMAHAKAGPPS